jgi:hypothetical protein
MSDSRFERLSLLGGVVFVVLTVLGAFLPGTPPDPSAPASEIVDYLSDNSGAIGAGSYMGGIGALFLLFWAGSLWRAMSRAEDGSPRLAVVAALGLVLGGAMATATAALFSAFSFQADQLGDQATVYWALLVTLQASAFVGLATQTAAVAALGIRTKFIPAWLAWGSAAAAILGIIGLLAVANDADTWLGFGFATFLVWSVWILCISAVLWRKLDAGPAAQM